MTKQPPSTTQQGLVTLTPFLRSFNLPMEPVLLSRKTLMASLLLRIIVILDKVQQHSPSIDYIRYASFHGHKQVLAELLSHMKSGTPAKKSRSETRVKSRKSSNTNADSATTLLEPLHLAAMNGHTDCVQLILDTIASSGTSFFSHLHSSLALPSVTDSPGGTENKTEDSPKGLIRHLVNARDKQGLTAAHHAALNGHVDPLSLLQQTGAGILELKYR